MKDSLRPALRLLRRGRLSLASLVSLCAVVCLSGPASANRSFLDHKNDAKAVVDKLVAEDYEGIRENFNAQMEAALSTEKMKESWRSVTEHLGEYKSQGRPHVGMAQDYEVVVIRCQMERGEVDIEVDYDPEGKIGGLWLRPLQ